MNLVDKLKLLRTDRELTRSDLAKLAGISYSTVAHMETSISTTSIATLAKLAHAYDLTLSELLLDVQINPYILVEGEGDPWKLTNNGN